MRAFCCSVALVVVAACSSGTEEPPSDDGEVVITGVGGGATATSGATGGSTTALTSASSGGASASSATSASASSSSSGGGGMAPVCSDQGVGEPNESENNAFELKSSALSDCDGDGDSVSGTLAGDSDVDWFKYEGDDGFTCVVDPTRAITQSESGLRLCKFFECVKGLGSTEVSCPSGTTESTSPGNRPGCCSSTGFEPGLNCTGTTDEHAYVYIRIDQPGATSATCNDYSVDYHY